MKIISLVYCLSFLGGPSIFNVKYRQFPSFGFKSYCCFRFNHCIHHKLINNFKVFIDIKTCDLFAVTVNRIIKSIKLFTDKKTLCLLHLPEEFARSFFQF